MNVSLTEELREYVQEKVASGLYHSSSEVIREALRLLREQDRLKEMQFRELREKVAEGLEQLDRGEGIDGEKVFAELKEKSAKRRKKSP